MQQKDLSSKVGFLLDLIQQSQDSAKTFLETDRAKRILKQEFDLEPEEEEELKQYVRPTIIFFTDHWAIPQEHVATGPSKNSKW